MNKSNKEIPSRSLFTQVAKGVFRPTTEVEQNHKNSTNSTQQSEGGSSESTKKKKKHTTGHSHAAHIEAALDKD